MVNKRKREDSSDSESDEIAPGKQVLPVANLPHNFDQEPQDGLQYLFLVRRDARRLPHVTRARNPYEVPQIDVTPTSTPLSSKILPNKEWNIAFQMHFSNMRKNLIQATIHVNLDHRKTVIPEKKDRDAWWKFLAGYPESEWSPRHGSARRKSNKPHHTGVVAGPIDGVHSRDATNLFDAQSGNKPCHLQIAGLDALPRNVPEQLNPPDIIQAAESTNLAPFGVDPWISSEGVGEGRVKQLLPPEVTPSHLREIDHRTSLHLLMYFTHWINVHLQNPTDPKMAISLAHGRWMFALLTKVEDQLSGDEMNLMRNLARACLGLIQKYRVKHAKDSTLPGEISAEDATTDMTEASCWIIFAAVAGHWGQRDLWADAESTLAAS